MTKFNAEPVVVDTTQFMKEDLLSICVMRSSLLLLSVGSRGQCRRFVYS